MELPNNGQKQTDQPIDSFPVLVNTTRMWKSPQFQFRKFGRKEETEPFNHKLRHGFQIQIILLRMMFGTHNQSGEKTHKFKF